MTTVHRLESLPRSPRRAWVLAALLGYPAAYGVLAVLKGTALPSGWVLGVFLLMILGTAVALWVSYTYTRCRVDGRRGVHLDERDRYLIIRAYALSHRVLAVVLLAVIAAVAVYLTSGHTIALDAANFVPLMLWVVLYVPALPVLMLAWIEPELPVDA